MKFEWDDKKAERNTLKHGISFEMTAFAFDDPYALVMEDEKHSDHERRQWLIGDSGENVLIVVFTMPAQVPYQRPMAIRRPMRLPGGNIRIISARRANRRERRLYEESKGI